MANNPNHIAALDIVTGRPRDLTRADLKALATVLDVQGFSEAKLRHPWREARNQDIAANIVGFVRQAALGDALEPWLTRVQRAIGRILSREKWDSPQRQWLERIGRRVAEVGVADAAALDEEQFRVAGGFRRLDKVFDGRLGAILADINDEAWKKTA